MHRYAVLSILFLIMACQKDTPSDCDNTQKLNDVSNFPIGSAGSFYSNSATYGNKFAAEFVRYTTENAAKMDNISTLKRVYDFFPVNGDARQAALYGLRMVHLHPIIWHKQLPKWVDSLGQQETKDVLLEYCQFYKKNLERGPMFQVEVTGMDVVNEALNEDGSFRRSFWYEAMGRDYIRLAFQEFTDLNPETKLFYNDYNLALNPRKLDAALDLCDWLRSTGVRVDGIGMQMHIDIHEPSQVDIAAAFEKISSRGYMVHVSELDVSINPRNTETTATPTLLSKQADVYAGIFRLYNQLPKKHQYGITVWGYSDADSWIPQEYNRFDAPLLIDAFGNKKPAYCACLNALKK